MGSKGSKGGGEGRGGGVRVGSWGGEEGRGGGVREG